MIVLFQKKDYYKMQLDLELLQDHHFQFDRLIFHHISIDQYLNH
jgi:hypothetical protein